MAARTHDACPRGRFVLVDFLGISMVGLCLRMITFWCFEPSAFGVFRQGMVRGGWGGRWLKRAEVMCRSFGGAEMKTETAGWLAWFCSTIPFMNAVGSKHSTAFLFSLQVA